MGVDLALYRVRIGRFVASTREVITTNSDYLCEAIASVRGGLTKDGLDHKGAVTFIHLLLRSQGIETNPGPRMKDRPSDTSKPRRRRNISMTMETTEVEDARCVKPRMEASGHDTGNDRPRGVSTQNTGNILDDTGSEPQEECAGAVALTSPSARPVALSTDGPRAMVVKGNVTINSVVEDKRRYTVDKHVEKMAVKYAENFSTGQQEIIHAEGTIKSPDRKTKLGKEEIPIKTENITKTEETTEGEDTRFSDVITQCVKPQMEANGHDAGNGRPRGVSTQNTGNILYNTGGDPQEECTMALASTSAGSVALPTGVPHGMIVKGNVTIQNVYKDKRRYTVDKHVGIINVKQAENFSTGLQEINHAGVTMATDPQVLPWLPTPRSTMATDPQEKHQDSSCKEKKNETIVKSPKRLNLEKDAEVMISRHEDETDKFLVIRKGAMKAAAKCLQNYNVVVIVGVTGEGKTTMAREIWKQMRDGNLDKDIGPKTPVLLTIPEDWNDVVNSKDDIVVFVDDIFGRTNYQADLLNRWKAFFGRIQSCLHEKHVYMLATSRAHILKDARRCCGVFDGMVDDEILLSKMSTVDLTEVHELTTEEKTSIYRKFSSLQTPEDDLDSEDSESSLEVYDDFFAQLSTLRAVHVMPSNIPIGFAQVCRLYFTNDKFHSRGGEFFKNPDVILTDEVERLRLQDPHKYFALVYCFLNDQSLDSGNLNPLKMSKPELEQVQLYAQACGVQETGSVMSLLENALDSLTGTYLTKQNAVYEFGHQSIADSVSLLFGKKNPDMILDKCSNRVILELLDVSETAQSDLCTLHVPQECYEHLIQRMCQMILEGDEFNRITLESFPRFLNQNLANCFFQYVTEHGKLKALIKAHTGESYSHSRSRSLLESCANNVTFLTAIYQLKVDEEIMEEVGILSFMEILQNTLQRSLKQKNIKGMEISLANGAVLTTECLKLAVQSHDKSLMDFVLANNMWTKSELRSCIGNETPEQTKAVTDALEIATRKCEVERIKNRYFKRRTYKSQTPSTLANMNSEDLTKAAKTMDFNILPHIFKDPLQEQIFGHLMRTMLDTLSKTLCDFMALKRVVGHIDGEIVQYALPRCDLETFRFLLLAADVTVDQVTAMLSDAIHLNKIHYIEILCKAGGKPSMSDFVHTAGSVDMGVSALVVQAIVDCHTWSTKQLTDVLDAAVCSGTVETMEVLVGGGAHFSDDVLEKVSGRPNNKSLTKLPSIDVPESVKYVFSKCKCSKEYISNALNTALKSGSFETVMFLMQEGGTFKHDALVEAVNRSQGTLDILKLVQGSQQWPVQELTNALTRALTICRSNVVEYLHTEGGRFEDDSLTNVLKWHVEHHVQIKIIKLILKARDWSGGQLHEAWRIALECKSNVNVLELLQAKQGDLELGTVVKLFHYDTVEKASLEKLIRSKKDNPQLNGKLTDCLRNKIHEGCMEIVEYLVCDIKIRCNDHSLSDTMDNSRNHDNYDRMKMVRLVRESRDWSEMTLSAALDKALRFGYTDVVLYLREHGVRFTDRSLDMAMLDKNVGYDIVGLVKYVIKSHRYDRTHLSRAIEKAVEMGHYKLMLLFHENKAKLPDGCLQKSVNKSWSSADRLPAVKFVRQSREWNGNELSDALFESIRLRDVNVISFLSKQGGEVTFRCISEALEKKYKPSHRLCILKHLLSASTALTREDMVQAHAWAQHLSEKNLVTLFQQRLDLV